MTKEQTLRVYQALAETGERLAKISTRKTFDVYQEREKMEEMVFLQEHMSKLLDMVEA